MSEYATPMSLMRAAMQQRAFERLHDYRIHVTGEFPFFNVRDYREYLYLGSFGWTSPNTKEKWLLSPHARDIGAGVWVTPGDIARDYLALKFPNRRVRMTSEEYKASVTDGLSPPRYAKPGSLYDGAVYFDLIGAYWQIIRACGWDVTYLPGEYLGSGESMTDFPFRHEKIARNCLVSIGNSKQAQIWTGWELKLKRTNNRFANRILWRLVCDVLNGVAFDVKNAGARYVYTDGYIVSGSNAAKVAEAIEAWGLRFDVRHHGAWGTVRAAGSYQVGSYQSTPYKLSTRVIPTDTIYDPGVEWLRWRFKRFVEVANRDWGFFKGDEGYDE